jgi:hypothetical protein
MWTSAALHGLREVFLHHERAMRARQPLRASAIKLLGEKRNLTS